MFLYIFCELQCPAVKAGMKNASFGIPEISEWDINFSSAKKTERFNTDLIPEVGREIGVDG